MLSSIVLLFALVYLVAPYGTFAGGVYVLASAIAATGMGLAVRRGSRLYRPAAWALVAAALGLAAVGHAIWYWLDLRGLDPFPSIADAFYLAVYPLFVIALLKLGHNSGHVRSAFSDALIVGIAAAVPGWALLIAPYAVDPDLTLVQLLISAAYPVADLILLPIILHLVFRHRIGSRAYQLLLFGMIAYFAADVLYAHGTSTGSYAPGGFVDTLWLVAYALFVAAVWHPSAAVEPPESSAEVDLSGRRLAVLAAASVIAPAVILFSAESDVEIVRVAAIASILLFLLVIYRMAGLMKEINRQSEDVERLSLTDPLTGAANRRHLYHALERELARADRSNGRLRLAFIDLDYFKQYNDAHGHSCGDALLRKLVEAWHSALRPTDILARIGGEEFVVVLPDMGADESMLVLDRLRSLVPYGQTCSAGIASYQPGDKPDSIIGRADNALYQAKDEGRDRVVLAEPFPDRLDSGSDSVG